MKKYFLYSTLIIASIFTAIIVISPMAYADSKSNIIDDGVFDNQSAMSESQIQNFINSFSSSCLLSQNQPSGLSSATFKTPTSYWSYETADSSPAHVIWWVSQYYHLNPQVILTTLEKEQNLVSGASGCGSWKYNSAMGYNCPDGSENSLHDYPDIGIYRTCVASISNAGFARQVNHAAWQLRFDQERSKGNLDWGDDGNVWYYGRMTQGYRARQLGQPAAYYDGYTTIDGESVYLSNGATAALYNYTPHFNSFYNIFTKWFDPYGAVSNSLVMNIVSQPTANPARGQDVSYTVSFTNTLSYDVTLDAVGVVGRLGDVYSGPNRDFGWQGPITLKPGIAQQFTFTTTIQDTGTIYAWPSVNYQGRYIHYNNWGSMMNAHQANISLTTPLSASPSNPIIGQPVTLTAAVKNNENVPIHIDSIGIPIRYYGQYNYDVAWTNTPGTIAPGATQSLSGSTTFDKPGIYTTWVSWAMSGQYTTLSSVNSYNISSLVPNFTLSYIETPDIYPAVGEDVTIKFKLKNNLPIPITLNAVGIVGRYDNPYSGPNRDFGWVGPETFAANEEKSYTTFVNTVSNRSNFYAWVAINYGGTYIHFNNWGFMMVPHTPNLSISSPLTTNPLEPILAGQTIAVLASVKNNETHPIHYDYLGIPVRYYGVYNYDATWVGPGVLAASGQVDDTMPLAGTVKLDKAGPYTLWTSINIKGNYISIGSVKQLNI